MKKIRIKRLWLRLWGPSEIHGLLHCSQGPGPMYRLNPPLIGPATPVSSLYYNVHLFCLFNFTAFEKE